MEIDQRFRNYQRRASKQSPAQRLICHLCELETDAIWDSYRDHFFKTHSDLLGPDKGKEKDKDVAPADREKLARKHYQQSIEKAKPPPSQPPPPSPSHRRRTAAATPGQSSTRAGLRSAAARPGAGAGFDPGVKTGANPGLPALAPAPAPAPTPVSASGPGPGPSPGPAPGLILTSGTARPIGGHSFVPPQASADRPPVSPTQSLKRHNSGEHSPPRRSKARPSQSGSAGADEPSRPKSNRTLWTPNAGQPSSGPRGGGGAAGGGGGGGGPSRGQASKSKPHLLPNTSSKAHRPGHSSANNSNSGNTPHQKQDNNQRGIIGPKKKPGHEGLIQQPETRPISQEQLVAEVKGIYAGLVLVESKCIEVDNSQTKQETAIDLNDEQWQALIALHRTLLQEHHDFFLASQHPTAKRPLRHLAKRYAMPARMWRHGIHSFLELLRHRLPHSFEHMLSFIYLAYSMMALLYETVPEFEETWIECLGDLGRYRMAIEDDSLEDRIIWTSVSRHWYSKASDKTPQVGRLYHHLAILARPDALQQMFYYSKSLCVEFPFASARDSITTLFEPVLSGQIREQTKELPDIDIDFVIIHAVLFTRKDVERLQPAMDSFIGGLDLRIATQPDDWKAPAYYISISNTCAMLNYGDASSPLMKAMKGQSPADDHPMDGSDHSPMFTKALELNYRTQRVIWRRFGDPNILAYLHTTLVPIYHLTRPPYAISLIAKSIPWKLLSVHLNTLITALGGVLRFEDSQFPLPDKAETPNPLPEDFAMRGLPWTQKYLPSNWFSDVNIDDDDKFREVSSMIEERRIRILWLGCRIASHGDWLHYDSKVHEFSVEPHYDPEVDELSLPPEGGVDAEGEALAVAEEVEDPMDTDELTVSHTDEPTMSPNSS